MRKFLLLIILLIGTPPSSWLQAQQVKVVSFNVHNNSNPRNDGNNTWNQRAKAVIEMNKHGEKPVSLEEGGRREPERPVDLATQEDLNRFDKKKKKKKHKSKPRTNESTQ